MNETSISVGIDVSQRELVVGQYPDRTTWTVPNTAKGIESLTARLQRLQPAVIVLEATGRLEMPAALSLMDAGLPAVVVNPRRPRAFAESLGKLAKTDRIDALVLAHFATVIPLEVRPELERSTLALQALVIRRRQLLEMVADESHRLSRTPPPVHAGVQAHIDWLKAQVKDLDNDIQQAIDAQPCWTAKQAILRSVPGVGPIVSALLLAHLPELGQLDRRTVASLVGVAPYNRDSGMRRGKRFVRHGRVTVRSPLYMAALVASRRNPSIATFYKRLRAAGKPAKVALTACMRKLLTILNAMLRDNLAWAPAA